MIKTEFHVCDFHQGDRVVLVNDELSPWDKDKELVPGIGGVVLSSKTLNIDPRERVCVNWNARASHLHGWWVHPWDIRPADFAQIDASDISSLL